MVEVVGSFARADLDLGIEGAEELDAALEGGRRAAIGRAHV